MSTESAFPQIPRFLYGTAWKEDATERCVENALKAGFRGIDTANQRMHYYEEGVGKALQSVYAQGLLTRADVFLQTKFTSRGGQDHRLPYDSNAPLATQVQQSFAKSLEHLGTDKIDSYVLHGPSTRLGLNHEDWEIWREMEALYRQEKVRYLGVSNVNLDQLRALCEEASVKPSFVQNRCFAKMMWDKNVREYCRIHGVTYQGFSLLTANSQIFKDPRFQEIGRRTGKTLAQLVFRFALSVGMQPLTGTTDPLHMREDLQALTFELSPEDVAIIEKLEVA